MKFGYRLVCVLWLGASVSVSAGTLAQFRSVLGNIDVELYDTDKPVTVQNFFRYIQTGAYTNDMFFHRWVPGFVIQGGGFYTADRHTTNAIVKSIDTFGPITNEYSAGQIYSNAYGTLAMARLSGQTNSANSEWFFNLTNNAFLDTTDGGFTVFGHVIGGTNVLNRFNLATTNNGIYILDIGSPLDQLPVLAKDATYEDLVYVDITLLNVQVAEKSPTERDISWNSVSNQVNRVQFTTHMPPTWQELVSTNGTGSVMSVADVQSTNSFRFYRVIVDY